MYPFPEYPGFPQGEGQSTTENKAASCRKEECVPSWDAFQERLFRYEVVPEKFSGILGNLPGIIEDFQVIKLRTRTQAAVLYVAFPCLFFFSRESRSPPGWCFSLDNWLILPENKGKSALHGQHREPSPTVSSHTIP